MYIWVPSGENPPGHWNVITAGETPWGPGPFTSPPPENPNYIPLPGGGWGPPPTPTAPLTPRPLGPLGGENTPPPNPNWSPAPGGPVPPYHPPSNPTNPWQDYSGSMTSASTVNAANAEPMFEKYLIDMIAKRMKK